MPRPPKRPSSPPKRAKPTRPGRPPRGRAGAGAKVAGAAGPRPTRIKAAEQGAQTRSPAEKAGPSHQHPTAARAQAKSKGLWLYGHHAVEAALANPRRSCHRLLATPEALARLDRPVRAGVEVQQVERAELDRRLGPATVHQGLALSVAPLPGHDFERICTPEPGRNLVVVLDQVSDPHNLGAILRTAEAFDARAVIVQERRSAELGGACAKAAAGALDRLPVVQVTNLTRTLEALAALGYWRIGLDAAAESAIEDAPEADDVAFVLGAEGSGLRRLVAQTCDLLVRLPISAAAESLNVSVAAGIALYAWRQRPKREAP
jgi:23S rRNA (guanosine2251-2'-O)-methyltransferase